MIVNCLFALLPLICAIAVNQVAILFGPLSVAVSITSAIVFVLSLVSVYVLYKRKFRSDLSVGIAFSLIIGTLLSFASSTVAVNYYSYVIVWMYLSMAVVALLPLFGVQPFSYLFSKWSFPVSVQTTNKFHKVNVILSLIWGLIFLSAIGLSLIQYSAHPMPNKLLQIVIPILLQIFVGVPITVLGPKVLNPRIYEKNYFSSIEQLFEMMPFGLNTRYAKAIRADVKVGFKLTGREPFEGTVVIKDAKCTVINHLVEDPTCVVKCDSLLWLAISNQEVDSIRASISGAFLTEGDPSIMLHFQNLFTTGLQVKLPKESYIDRSLYNEFARIKPLKAKKVAVFYSGERTNELSKTYMMVEHFMRGVADAGAEVELVRLKTTKMHSCVGCYQCWTKTPGECIFKDDMSKIRETYRSADWVVMASPLFIFSVNGLMKTFMDRLLPNMKPYMAFNATGATIHPDRFPELGEQRILMMSAGGFPDVKDNFSAMSEQIKLWASHSENALLAGELYLPAAEMLSVPNFYLRRLKVQKLAYEIGKAIVNEGVVPVELMQQLSDVEMSKDRFHELANAFWGNLDGQEAFLHYAKHRFVKN